MTKPSESSRLKTEASEASESIFVVDLGTALALVAKVDVVDRESRGNSGRQGRTVNGAEQLRRAKGEARAQIRDNKREGTRWASLTTFTINQLQRANVVVAISVPRVNKSRTRPLRPCDIPDADSGDRVSTPQAIVTAQDG